MLRWKLRGHPSARALRLLGVGCCIAVGIALAPLASPGQSVASKPIGIIAATEGELEPLKSRAIMLPEREIEGWKFREATIDGRAVVFVRSGVAKVNAACATTLLIEHYKPSAVLMVGVAGAINPELRSGDVIVGQKTIQHDLVTYSQDEVTSKQIKSPVDGTENPVAIDADAKLLTRLEGFTSSDGSKVIRGVIASGDAFIASASKKAALQKTLGADAVDMESAAVAQVCLQQGVPFIAVRAVSDSADAEAAGDLRKSFKVVCERAAEVALMIVAGTM